MNGIRRHSKVCSGQNVNFRRGDITDVIFNSKTRKVKLHVNNTEFFLYRLDRQVQVVGHSHQHFLSQNLTYIDGIWKSQNFTKLKLSMCFLREAGKMPKNIVEIPTKRKLGTSIQEAEYAVCFCRTNRQGN